MNIANAKGLSVIDFLEREGFKPCQIKGDNYWYLSPLRNEMTPSFKVNRRLNSWYDYGIAVGGDLVELAKRLRGFSSVAETLHYLDNDNVSSSIRAFRISEATNNTPNNKMQKMKVVPLQNSALFYYLHARHIHADIGKMYCREIHYELNNKHYFAIAFCNISGGYEIRNPYFKGCFGHKDISVMAYTPGEWQNGCMIFEGFMDFLSYLTLARMNDYRFLLEEKCDYLILNSISNLRKALPHLERYRHIHCFLDNDSGGKSTVEAISELYKYRTIDESFRYADYKDVNDYLRGKKSI